MADLELKLPDFDGVTAAFGARLRDYPGSPNREEWRQSVPEQFANRKNPFAKVVDALFFRGGTLADHGLKIKDGLDKGRVMKAIKAWLSSFEPKHEHKTAVVAWAISEWCEPISAAKSEAS